LKLGKLSLYLPKKLKASTNLKEEFAAAFDHLLQKNKPKKKSLNFSAAFAI